MSALTAALTAVVLTTPIVQVTHDRIVETPRVAEIVIQPGASDIGIDDTGACRVNTLNEKGVPQDAPGYNTFGEYSIANGIDCREIQLLIR